MLKTNNIGMMKGPMNFNFTHQLLFGPCFGQRAFLNNFGSQYVQTGLVNNLVDLGESSLSQELALLILFGFMLAIELDDPFFDDHLLAVVVVVSIH